jgi:hypothetical protein
MGLLIIFFRRPEMANLLLNYTVANSQYQKGKFRFIQGNNGASPPTIDDPLDTKLGVINALTDNDPVLFSYQNGSAPRALLCNITTSGGTSTGKYTICVPNTSATPVSWSILKQDISLKTSGGDNVAGNPHGIIKIGNFLYIVDYDTLNITRLDITAFEGTASGGDYTPTVAPTPPGYFPSTAAAIHGEGIITLTDSSGLASVTYLYALFSCLDSSGNYLPSVIVRYAVNTSGVLNNPKIAWVGKNAMALVPAVLDGITYILVPAVGGMQNGGFTNGTNSDLTLLNAFSSTDFTGTAPTKPKDPVITGDSQTAVTPTGNYDILGVAVSADGNNAYILLNSYDTAYNSCWRLYKTTLSTIVATQVNTPISGLGLTSVDNGFGDPAGYYWEVLYDNTVSGGRLWFLKGSPIRVSNGGTYGTVLKEIGDILYGPGGVNVNSADLIGEMLYQAAQGAAVNTRLGTTRHLAKAVQAAKAAAEEEEEK